MSKWRGYSEADKCWKYGQLLTTTPAEGVRVVRTYEVNGDSTEAEVDPYTTGVWSGFKDSQGVDFYEGDIIYLEDYGRYIGKDPFVTLYTEGQEKTLECRIVGNIRENPDMATSPTTPKGAGDDK